MNILFIHKIISGMQMYNITVTMMSNSTMPLDLEVKESNDECLSE